MASFYAQLIVNESETSTSEGSKFNGTSSKTSTGYPIKKPTKASPPSINVRKIATKAFGTIGASILYANSKVGEYTGNHLQTSNTNALLGTAITVGVGILAGHPVMAGVGLGLMVAKGAIDVGIKQINSQQESTYRRSLVGSPTTSGSRWGGKYNWFTTYK